MEIVATFTHEGEEWEMGCDGNVKNPQYQIGVKGGPSKVKFAWNDRFEQTVEGDDEPIGEFYMQWCIQDYGTEQFLRLYVTGRLTPTASRNRASTGKAEHVIGDVIYRMVVEGDNVIILGGLYEDARELMGKWFLRQCIKTTTLMLAGKYPVLMGDYLNDNGPATTLDDIVHGMLNFAPSQQIIVPNNQLRR